MELVRTGFLTLSPILWPVQQLPLHAMSILFTILLKGSSTMAVSRITLFIYEKVKVNVVMAVKPREKESRLHLNAVGERLVLP